MTNSINPLTGRPFAKDYFKDYARDQPCLIRVAVICGYECSHGTTVLCHPSLAGLKAIGSRKASVPDIGAAWGCRVCHDLCDGRLRPQAHSAVAEFEPGTYKMVLDNALLEGTIRTINALVRAGVLPNP